MADNATLPLFEPADFRIPAGCTHVCAGGETPFLLRHVEAFARYAEDKSRGADGRTLQEAVVERTRGQLAALWGVRPDEVAWAGR